MRLDHRPVYTGTVFARLAWCLSVTSCFPNTDVDGLGFRCAQSSDCRANETCIAARCTPTEQIGNVINIDFNTSTGDDTSGRGHHGRAVILPPQYVEGRYGQALRFDAMLDQRLLITDTPDLFLGTNATIEAWLFRMHDDRDQQVYDSGYEMDIELRPGVTGPPTTRFVTADCNANINGVGSPRAVIPLDAWVHLAVTRNGEEINFYLDGELSDTMPHTKLPCLATTENVVVGGRGGSAYFDGVIDEFKLSDYAKTQAQIQASLAHDSAAWGGK